MATNNVIISLPLIFNQYEHRRENVIWSPTTLYTFSWSSFDNSTRFSHKYLKHLFGKLFLKWICKQEKGCSLAIPPYKPPTMLSSCTLVNEKINMIFSMPSCVFLVPRNSQKEKFKSYIYQWTSLLKQIDFSLLSLLQ